MGYLDYAILLSRSTYGLRDGEIQRLRLEDIDWRAETLQNGLRPFECRN